MRLSQVSKVGRQDAHFFKDASNAQAHKHARRARRHGVGPSLHPLPGAVMNFAIRLAMVSALIGGWVRPRTQTASSPLRGPGSPRREIAPVLRYPFPASCTDLTMRKLVFLASIAALAFAGVAGRASAGVVLPGATGGFGCDLVLPGSPSVHTGGPISGSSGSCAVSGATATTSTQPFVLMTAIANARGLPPIDRAFVQANAVFSYYFTVIGGNIGDLVPALVHTTVSTTASDALDANNGNGAFANVRLGRLNSALQVVGYDANLNICTASPVPACTSGSFDGI